MAVVVQLTFEGATGRMICANGKIGGVVMRWDGGAPDAFSRLLREVVRRGLGSPLIPTAMEGRTRLRPGLKGRDRLDALHLFRVLNLLDHAARARQLRFEAHSEQFSYQYVAPDLAVAPIDPSDSIVESDGQGERVA